MLNAKRFKNVVEFVNRDPNIVAVKIEIDGFFMGEEIVFDKRCFARLGNPLNPNTSLIQGNFTLNISDVV
jgi:hypothetical protein